MKSVEGQILIRPYINDSLQESSAMWWQVVVPLPKDILPEYVRNKPHYGFSKDWIFQNNRILVRTQNKEWDCALYAEAFRSIARQFEEWAKLLDAYQKQFEK